MRVMLDLLSLFSLEDNCKISIEETLHNAIASTCISSFRPPDTDKLKESMLQIHSLLEGDKFELTLKIYSSSSNDVLVSETYEFSCNTANIGTALLDIIDKIKNFDLVKKTDEECLHVLMKITKPLSSQKVHRIYFFEKFIDYLKQMPLATILNAGFSNSAVRPGDNIIFLVDENVKEFYSENIFFLHNKNNLNDAMLREKNCDKLQSNWISNCHLANFKLNFSPYSFLLIEKSNNEDINSIFDNLLFVLSIIFIADYSEIVDDSIKVRIRGYRFFDELLNLSKIQSFTSSPETKHLYYNIFDWVYGDNNENNTSEKIGLSRNIITLDVKDSLLDITPRTLESIKSNYEIYLRENVDRYIEIKNKITDSIIDMSLKNRELIDRFANDFKNSLLTVQTFIFTVLILNIINNNADIHNIFNKELSIIYIFMVAISCVFLYCSNYSINKDIEQYTVIYSELKSSYKNLLSSKDLDDIFDNEIHRKDKDYVKSKKNTYFRIWILLITISLIVLWYLSSWMRNSIISFAVSLILSNSI